VHSGFKVGGNAHAVPRPKDIVIAAEIFQ